MIDTSIQADEIPMEKGDKVNFCARNRIDGPAKLHRISYSAYNDVQGPCLLSLSFDGLENLLTFAYDPNHPGNWPHDFTPEAGFSIIVPEGSSLFMDVTDGAVAMMIYSRP